MKETWVIGCRKNKKQAQEQLYQYYSPKVMGVCKRYCNDAEEAKDIFQEAFINIFKSIKKETKIEFLDAWIRKVTVNTALSYYKKNKKHQHFLSTDDLYESNDDYEQIIGRLENKDLVLLINQLPEGCRLVFNLYVIEGYNHKEIAEKVNISEGTSKSQLSRAKKILKSKLSLLEPILYEKIAT